MSGRRARHQREARSAPAVLAAMEQELLAAMDCKHQDRYVGLASAMGLAATRVQALLALTRGPPGTSIDMRGMRSPRSAITAIQ